MRKEIADYVLQITNWVKELAETEPHEAIAFCEALPETLHEIKLDLQSRKGVANTFVIPDGKFDG